MHGNNSLFCLDDVDINYLFDNAHTNLKKVFIDVNVNYSNYRFDVILS